MSAPLLFVAPGAGAPSTSAWMRGWTRRLETLGRVVTVDYPYMLAGRHSPDRLPILIAAHRQALQTARSGHSGKVILCGKSMGGRVGCHVALEAEVSGLVCFGYPLRGAGRRGALRDEVLSALKTPILFVQGTKDPLCPLDLLEQVRPRMTAQNDLYVVDGGNHSLEVSRTWLKARGETQEDVDERVFAAVEGFVGGLG